MLSSSSESRSSEILSTSLSIFSSSSEALTSFNGDSSPLFRLKDVFLVMLLLTADFCVFRVDTLETFGTGDGAAVSHLDRLDKLSAF